MMSPKKDSQHTDEQLIETLPHKHSTLPTKPVEGIGASTLPTQTVRRRPSGFQIMWWIVVPLFSALIILSLLAAYILSQPSPPPTVVDGRPLLEVLHHGKPLFSVGRVMRIIVVLGIAYGLYFAGIAYLDKQRLVRRRMQELSESGEFEELED